MNNFEYIQNNLSNTEILAQLAEEAAELSQAALKMRRAVLGINPTPVTVEEALKSVIEEFADVNLCYDLLNIHIPMTYDRTTYDRTYITKCQRWADRLEERP